MTHYDYNFSVCYVLTTSDDNHYLRLTIASALSVRITHPTIRIIILIDEKSFANIDSDIQILSTICNRIITITTPDGNALFRNRWIKTQIPKYITTSVLFLDSDILIRDSLHDLPTLVSNIGAVANHNAVSPRMQLWEEDLSEIRIMNWHVDLVFYPNGGMFFFHQTPEVNKFFERWHKYWLQNYNKTGRGRDQPSLYFAISNTGLEMDKLADVYNVQLLNGNIKLNTSKALHLYENQQSIQFPLGKYLMLFDQLPFSYIRKIFPSMLISIHDWPNPGIITKYLQKKYHLHRFSLLWYSKRRLHSVFCFIKTSLLYLYKHTIKL